MNNIVHPEVRVEQGDDLLSEHARDSHLGKGKQDSNQGEFRYTRRCKNPHLSFDRHHWFKWKKHLTRASPQVG